MDTPRTEPVTPASTTLTVRLTPEVKERLGRLADTTHHTKSFLAAEAIAAYVTREAEIVGGIERGLTDMIPTLVVRDSRGGFPDAGRV